MYGRISDPDIVSYKSPGAAESRRCPEEQLSARTGSMGRTQISNQLMGAGFDLARRYRPGGCRFLSPG